MNKVAQRFCVKVVRCVLKGLSYFKNYIVNNNEFFSNLYLSTVRITKVVKRHMTDKMVHVILVASKAASGPCKKIVPIIKSIIYFEKPITPYYNIFVEVHEVREPSQVVTMAHCVCAVS